MASEIIHICVADKINKSLHRNKEELLLGSMAPDLAKPLCIDKNLTHFIDNENSIPNMGNFVAKYKDYLDNDFVLGYYIHLYTDYYWFKYFINDIIKDGKIYMLDGSVIDETEDTVPLVYDDYTSLNKDLIDDYKLDLSFFEYDKSKIKDIIEEIPLDKLDVLIEKTAVILKVSEEKKPVIFDKEMVNGFIDKTSSLILERINSNNLY